MQKKEKKYPKSRHIIVMECWLAVYECVLAGGTVKELNLKIRDLSDAQFNFSGYDGHHESKKEFEKRRKEEIEKIADTVLNHCTIDEINCRMARITRALQQDELRRKHL